MIQPKPAKTPVEMVAVTVNGEELQLPQGKNLLAALLEADIYIPHYCWHPSLTVDGNCRLCLIEIEGQPRPGISCNMKCAEGLKIRTEGEMVEDCRKGMMEFLLVNHPLDCPICDRGGECMLQRYSMTYGTGHARTTDDRRRFEKPQLDPLIDIERNRCIMCTRCVRFMDQVAGEHTLAVYGRGDRNYIGTFGDRPVANVFSGNIIDICPVGCLTSKPYRFNARPWELQQVASTCTLCSAGCPTTAWLRGGHLHRMTPPARKIEGEYTIDENTTQFICNEGRFGNSYVNSADRLLKASISANGSASAVSFDEALSIAVEALAPDEEAGPDRAAILCGVRATSEEYYLLSHLARSILGTNQIDWRLGFTSDEAARMGGLALSASDADLDLLEDGSYGATLVINAQLHDTIPVVGLKIKEAARLGHTRLGVLGSRVDAWLNRHAEASAILPPAALGEAIEAISKALETGSSQAGAPQGLVDLLAGNDSGLVVLGVDTAGGAMNASILGPVLRLLRRLGPAWRFLPAVQGRNARGALAAGAQSDRLPGGALNSQPARQRMIELWGALKASDQPGPTAPEILRRAADGKISALLLHRCDELVHHPQRALIERALDATPNVIVIDTFPSWITERATVVLPGALFLETEGSMVGVDGTLRTLRAGNHPPGDAQEDWRIIAALSEGLGGAQSFKNPGEIFAQLLSCWDVPRRFTLADLALEFRQEGKQLR
ncbi:molybdopterin-dependent oxidoreductase, partial [Candidatus Sumerlaeota bacterium]|nr:molybdopterin-dependent oxidoreductase [Candidatus Sumerlaeota bacterium]